MIYVRECFAGVVFQGFLRCHVFSFMSSLLLPVLIGWCVCPSPLGTSVDLVASLGGPLQAPDSWAHPAVGMLVVSMC